MAMLYILLASIIRKRSGWPGCTLVSFPIISADVLSKGRFCHVLDARKSGLRVKPEVKAKDMKKYGGILDSQLQEGRDR